MTLSNVDGLAEALPAPVPIGMRGRPTIQVDEEVARVGRLEPC